MYADKRLSEVFDSSEEISFDDSSKFILFSDCHRGDNSWADDLAHNQNIFFHALTEYNEQKFTYIEIGDGDELWENKRFEVIRKAHDNIFWKLQAFHNDNRFYLIWGNHNRKWKKPKNVEKHLHEFYNDRKECVEPLFEGMKVHEGLVLRHSDTGNKILILHGHQADILNDRYWWFSRFIVRHVWKPLQVIGARDPTSPAKNFKKRMKIEKDIIDWIVSNKQMVICGHTHRSEFPEKEEKPLYFNTGSCVHPRCITGIEIQNGDIELIKWVVEPNEDGALCVKKRQLEGPKKVQFLWDRYRRE